MSATAPLLDLSAITFLGGGLGDGLERPECLLCTSNGDLYSSDGRGGVALSGPSGLREIFRAAAGSETLLPNGIALQRDGSFLVTNLHESGGVFRLDRDGKLSEVLRKVDGVDLPATNFVLADDRGRVWVTVSTRQSPRFQAFHKGAADGFVVLIDGKGARIVADKVGYANELQLDRQGQHLYLNETFGRCLTRFNINRFGELSAPTVVTEFGAGTFPDGLAMDVEEHLWVTSPVSNRVIRVAPDGAQTLILEDSDPDHLAAVEVAYKGGSMGRVHFEEAKSQKLRNISSLAFGGPDLRTAYLGSLLGDGIASFRSPIMGRPPTHWHFNV